MTYRIQVAPAAVRQLRKLDTTARRRVQAAIELLAEHPRPSGAKMLVGGAGEWRVRTGEYRVVYEIRDDVLLVLVVTVGHSAGRLWTSQTGDWGGTSLESGVLGSPFLSRQLRS